MGTLREPLNRTIWLLRHGESEWNAAARWQGHGDPPLSERGRREAEGAAAKVAATVLQEGSVRLYCSDLQRAIDTAEAVGQHLSQRPVPLRALRELDVGSWTGLTRSEIERRDPEALRAFEAEQLDVRPGGGESRREIRARVRSAVTELANAVPDDALLLVVHLGVVRALIPGTQPDHLDLNRTTLEKIRALD